MSRTVDTLHYCEWCNIVTDKVADKQVKFNGYDYNACPQCNEIVGFDSKDYLLEVGRWELVDEMTNVYLQDGSK